MPAPDFAGGCDPPEPSLVPDDDLGILCDASWLLRIVLLRFCERLRSKIFCDDDSRLADVSAGVDGIRVAEAVARSLLGQTE
jgi:hypothetical protein